MAYLTSIFIMRTIGPVASVYTIKPMSINPINPIVAVHAAVTVVSADAAAVIAVTVIVAGDLVRVKADADNRARHVNLVFQPGVLQALIHCKTGPGKQSNQNMSRHFISIATFDVGRYCCSIS